MPSNETVNQESLKAFDQYLQDMKNQLHNSLAMCFGYISTTIVKMGTQEQSAYLDSYLDVFYKFLDSIKIAYAKLYTENFMLKQENATLKEKLTDALVESIIADIPLKQSKLDIGYAQDQKTISQLREANEKFKKENAKLRVTNANLLAINQKIHANLLEYGNQSELNANPPSHQSGMHFLISPNSTKSTTTASKDLQRNSNDNKSYGEKPSKKLRL